MKTIQNPPKSTLSPALSHPMGEGEDGGALPMDRGGALLSRRCEGPGATAIQAAYRTAQDAAGHAVQKALICGQLMLEQREAIANGSRTSPRGKSSIQIAVHGRNQHSDGDGFMEWLAAECPDIPKTTAYRWMDAAARVGHAALASQAPALLGMAARGDARPTMPLGRIWTAQEADLPEPERKVKQLLLDFTAHKTLKDCLMLDGGTGDDFEKAAIGAVRAVNGRDKGGTHPYDDRGDFPRFVARALIALTTNVGRVHERGHEARSVAAAEEAVKTWPRWFLSEIGRLASREAKLTDAERNDSDRKYQATRSLRKLGAHNLEA